MKKHQAIIITLLTLLVLMLGILNAQRLYIRFDITRNKSYTLSEVSKNLYKEIPEQVTITYYVSDKLVKMHPVPGEIQDLLQEYAAQSKGKIRFFVKDPVKAGVAVSVERLGIQPQQIQTVEQDQASVATVYTGIVIQYLDKTEVLPVVFSLDTLEYDLTSRIRTLVKDTEREVGVLVADADKSWTNDYQYVDRVLKNAGYKVRQIFKGDEIPQGLSALFVFGGAEDLDDWDLYRLDYYLQRGGKILFAVDGVFVDSRSNLQARPVQDKGLLRMLETYGVRLENQLVLDKANLTIPYQSMSMSGMVQVKLVRYPHWVVVLPQNANSKHPLTARFDGLDLFWASPLTVNPPSGVSGDYLFTSTKEAWLMTKDFITNPDMEAIFTSDASKTKGQYTLGTTLKGTFPSYFKGKPKPIKEGSKDMLPDMPTVANEGRLIIIGDSEFPTSLVQYTNSNQNLEFLVQAADWLGNDNDILSIRTRLPASARLNKISDPIERARSALMAQLINVVLIPLLVLIYGVYRTMRRKAKLQSREARNAVSA
ncbi:GldG family protein [Gracilinema caldarium]|uniref:GldG family protein n=1 Tax=Gracilinema caldarium TaxID=215591 RepID=UPI0026EF86CE|nr:GldG family protein [Gracilinema caldarium]